MPTSLYCVFAESTFADVQSGTRAVLICSSAINTRPANDRSKQNQLFDVLSFSGLEASANPFFCLLLLDPFLCWLSLRRVHALIETVCRYIPGGHRGLVEPYP